uniref:FA_desaturase domain-containing protein n=1 Tax=Meloidogyne hapla TaxID=6305 RepID=A0A1I8B826_MELHA
MVLTDYFHENPAKSVPFRLCIDGKWIDVDEQLLRAHPGGGAMLTYRNLEATAVFHAFHANSKLAYSWLRERRAIATSEDSLKILNENGTVNDLAEEEHTGENEEKNRWWNDCCGYICGNFLQGFSLAGWKNQHNVHHAATNIDGRDGDLDLLPLWATVGTHLMVFFLN